MIANPKIDQLVQIHYAARRTPFPARMMPLHGMVGVVTVVSRGKPRNHGVVVDGVLWVVPCGNLRKVEVGDGRGDSGQLELFATLVD